MSEYKLTAIFGSCASVSRIHDQSYKIIYRKQHFSATLYKVHLTLKLFKKQTVIVTIAEGKNTKEKSALKIDDRQLENISGGAIQYPNWIYGTVHDIVRYDDRSCLQLHKAPNEDCIYTNDGNPIGWQNGERILIDVKSRAGNWIKTKYQNIIGWVDANYVWY